MDLKHSHLPPQIVSVLTEVHEHDVMLLVLLHDDSVRNNDNSCVYMKSYLETTFFFSFSKIMFFMLSGFYCVLLH